MNHIFRVVFDKTRGVFVAVSELTKRHGKEKSIQKQSSDIHRGVAHNITSAVFSWRPSYSAILVGLTYSFLISPNAIAGPDIRSAYTSIASRDCNNNNLYGVDLAVPIRDSGQISEDTQCPAAQYTVAIGAGAFIGGTDSGTGIGGVAIGTRSIAAQEATALGYNANAGYIGSVAIGNAAVVSGKAATAVGRESSATTNAVALGYQAKARAQQTIVIGHGAEVLGSAAQAIVIGAESEAYTNETIVIGYNASSKQNTRASIIIGKSASAGSGAENNVILGNAAESKNWVSCYWS
ncbi:hypothetical protein QV06_09830 [Gallibacterium genomosp. 3]|uniref:ESPR domain-containing protein n=1 Tax=Gallibacterium genomosp. 3 TaxID=505345 RepID=A0A1A7PQL5_9PAST|nr:ESPR-type extended signal peptide-containing protein [Gallibacterium genomosp. 3]OBX03445.1 hypothetical protein QV06_09830 [Gallibacterium genomosp. 3]